MNLSEKLLSACGKPVESCTNRELYEALLTMVQQEACSRTSEAGKKKVCKSADAIGTNTPK